MDLSDQGLAVVPSKISEEDLIVENWKQMRRARAPGFRSIQHVNNPITGVSQDGKFIGAGFRATTHKMLVDEIYEACDSLGISPELAEQGAVRIQQTLEPHPPWKDPSPTVENWEATRDTCRYINTPIGATARS